jgi:MarC family membrane protein
MDVSFTSAVVILLLVMDPVGNIPLFITLLKDLEPRRRLIVVARECAIAFGILLIFTLWGQRILDVLGLSGASLTIAGGVILFLIALRMVFRHPQGVFGDEAGGGEPFIVPLAIPAIAGPTTIATIVLMVSRAPERMGEWLVALTIATAITLLLLLFAERIGRLLGSHALAALERLMGLVLTAIAVQMLLAGIESFVQRLQG